MANQRILLKGHLNLLLTRLDVTEPMALDDGCSVAGLSLGENGLVGLDVETGRPIYAGCGYKSIAEKPVVINSGSSQKMIAPRVRQRIVDT